MGLGGLYRVPEIKPILATSKTSSLSTVLSLHVPLSLILFQKEFTFYLFHGRGWTTLSPAQSLFLALCTVIICRYSGEPYVVPGRELLQLPARQVPFLLSVLSGPLSLSGDGMTLWPSSASLTPIPCLFSQVSRPGFAWRFRWCLDW